MADDDVSGSTLRSDTGSQANITLTGGKEWMEKEVLTLRMAERM